MITSSPDKFTGNDQEHGSGGRLRVKTAQSGAQQTRNQKRCSSNSCAPSPLVDPLLVIVFLIECSSWCDGSVCDWGLLNDWALSMCWSSPFLVKATFQSWLRLLLAYQRGSTPLRKSSSRSVMLQVSYRGSALVSRCVPLSSVYWWTADFWQATVRGLRVPQGESQRDLAAPEVERVAMVRCIARLRRGSRSCSHPEWGVVPKSKFL